METIIGKIIPFMQSSYSFYIGGDISDRIVESDRYNGKIISEPFRRKSDSQYEEDGFSHEFVLVETKSKRFAIILFKDTQSSSNPTLQGE